MREYRTWRELLIERLTADWEEAIGYLQVTLEEYQIDGNASVLLLALWTVVESQGGISEVAKKARIDPQVLSDAFASEKAPRIDTISMILRALGCRLSIEPLEEASSDLGCGDENYPGTPKKVADTNLEVATEGSNPQ